MPAFAAVLSSKVLRADERDSRDDRDDRILGSWNSIHSLPFPPGSFREFLSFAEGGVMHETNSFLNTSSNTDFSFYGLPSAVNAADGIGDWEPLRNGAFRIVFRKMLFDGSRQNFGDLHVTGQLRIGRGKLAANWHIEVLNPAGDLLVDLSEATSESIRLR